METLTQVFMNKDRLAGENFPQCHPWTVFSSSLSYSLLLEWKYYVWPPLLLCLLSHLLHPVHDLLTEPLSLPFPVLFILFLLLCGLQTESGLGLLEGHHGSLWRLLDLNSMALKRFRGCNLTIKKSRQNNAEYLAQSERNFTGSYYKIISFL